MAIVNIGTIAGFNTPPNRNIVKSSNGTLVLFAITSGTTLKYNTSTDNGATWAGSWITVNTLVNQFGVDIDSSDNIHVIIRESAANGGGYVKLTYSLGTWSVGTMVTIDSHTAGWHPSIAVLDNDNIYITFAPNNGGIYFYYKVSSDGGATWSEPTPIWRGTNKTIASLADGNTWRDIVLTTAGVLNYAGTQVATGLPVTLPYFDAVRVDSSNIYIAVATTSGITIFYYNGSWDAGTLLSDNASDSCPTLQKWGSKIVCTWRDYDGSNYDIAYKVLTGGVWGNQVNIVTDANSDNYPNSIIKDSNFIYTQYQSPTNQLQFYYFPLTKQALAESLKLIDNLKIGTILSDVLNLEDNVDEYDLPGIKNIVASQRNSDGKVTIAFDIKFSHFESAEDQLYIKFQYWNGSSWQECTTTTGEGIQTITPNNWTSLTGEWTAKTDIDGTYYAATKIRVLGSYDNVHWGSTDSSNFALDVKDPIVTLVSPLDAVAQILVRFPFTTSIAEDSSYQIKIEISLLDGGSFSAIKESEWLNDVEIWDYANDIRPLMYGTYYWRVTAIDEFQNQTVSEIFELIVQDVSTEIRVDSIVKEITGSGIAKIFYSIKDANYEKISVRFDFTEDDGDTYRPCKIIEISSGSIEDDCFITNLLATPTYVQYWARIQYSNDPEIQIVTEELKKRNLKVSSRVYINRDGTDVDISNIASSIDLSRNKQFGAAQLTVNCIDKDFLYNPNNTVSENNLVSSVYNPLVYIGNIVKFSLKFLTGSGIKVYDKFVGYINNVEISKNSVGKNVLKITSQDYLQKLMNYMPEDLEYKTVKLEIPNEYLKTFDGVTYYAEFGSWTEYPAPIIKINNVVLSYDKYIIDFVRGQVIYKGNALSNLITKTQTCTNLLGDLKTFEIDTATNNSIQPKVYRAYQKYENFTCNDYTGSFNQWVDYVEELHELDDYYIDYDSGIINLYDALSADNPTETINNINNQEIVITYKEATTVTATYSYEEAGSNEVEDIIRNLATLAGIPIANMKDTVTDENLIVRGDSLLFTEYNNIDSLTLKRNGVTLTNVTDYALTKRDGIIELDSSDVNSKHKMIEDCDYIWDTEVATESGETVVQEIDTTDKEEGTGSLKVTFPTNGGYILRDLFGDLYNVSITTQKYIEFYIKADKTGTVYLDTSYNNINWESKTISVTDTWTLVQWDVSAFGANYKDIKYLKLRGTDIVVWIDNIYIKRNLYTATYTYYTLQATEVTLSKVIMNYENTENAFSAIQDLLKNVAPNYLLYFDDDNKLVGYYSNQRLLRNCLNCWNNFNEGNRGYTRSYYGEHYRLNLPTNLVHNISDEDVYTGCIVIGKNTEPQNVALKGSIVDNCTWVTGKGYALAITKTTKGQYGQAKAAISEGDILFKQLSGQNTTELNASAIDTLLDFDANTGYQWYKKNKAPAPNILMCTLTLEKAILWDRIDILVGSYDSKVIKEMLYITVGDETGANWWYTEKNKLKVEGGASGSWITFENNFNQNIKIKYIRVYCSEPWQWTVTTTTSGGKGGGSSSASTDYFYAFSLGEIEVWEKATLIGKRTLDNALMIGDGITDEVQIPNTPYKTKDYLLYKWGWVEKHPDTIRLWSNSFSTELIVDVDFTYDKTTGIVTFLSVPAIGDVISGTWTLDDLDPKGTTFYASFANVDLIKRIGLKYYKEVDEGLFTHNQTINRAGEILPELSRSVFPGNIDIVYRPDIKLGQSVLVINDELSLNRIFYVDSINLGIEGFVPKCSLGITSYLELKDYEYQETVPSIYRDWKINYPKYLMAFASYNTNVVESSAAVAFYTGGITVEAMDENSNVKLDYNEECKLELVTMEDSLTFSLLETTVKTEMWEDGTAELNFYIQWNQDGLGSRAKTPTELIAEDKWYVDKEATFKFYETNNPTKVKFFTTTIRLYLVGTLKPLYLTEVGALGEAICYDNYNIVTAIASTTKDGKQFVSDNLSVHTVLGVDDVKFSHFVINGQNIFRMMSTVVAKTYQIEYYDWVSEAWTNWGTTFSLVGSTDNGGGLLWGFFGGRLIIGATTNYEYGGHYYSFDGKVLTALSAYTANYPYIFNSQLFICHGGDVLVYNSSGVLIGTYGTPAFPRYNTGNVLFVLKGYLYMCTAFVSTVGYGGLGQVEQKIWKWNDTLHQWVGQYTYTKSTRAYPYINAAYVYKNVAYLFYDTYDGGKFYPPFVAMFDPADSEVYLKGYLTNKDWGLLGTRAAGSSKGMLSYFMAMKGNVYGVSSSGVIKCMNPYFDTSKKQLLFESEP